MENSKLTEQDIFVLVQGKMKNPDMKMDDLYKQIDDIHPSDPLSYYVIVSIIWIVLLCCLAYVLWGSNTICLRASCIVYILCGLLYIYFRNKFNKSSWWVSILFVILGYIALSADFTADEFFKMVKKVFG